MKHTHGTMATSDIGSDATHQPELGSASIRIELSDSCITVCHGTDGTVLLSRPVSEGFWDRLWTVLDDK